MPGSDSTSGQPSGRGGGADGGGKENTWSTIVLTPKPPSAAAPLMGKKKSMHYDEDSYFYFFTAAKRRSTVKALRKRDARNVHTLRLAHVAAGKVVGADRLTPQAGGSCTSGETRKGCPTRILNWGAKLISWLNRKNQSIINGYLSDK
jgi:hypothetical protein